MANEHPLPKNQAGITGQLQFPPTFENVDALDVVELITYVLNTYAGVLRARGVCLERDHAP